MRMQLSLYMVEVIAEYNHMALHAIRYFPELTDTTTDTAQFAFVT